jgi:hypothetical protein
MFWKYDFFSSVLSLKGLHGDQGAPGPVGPAGPRVSESQLTFTSWTKELSRQWALGYCYPWGFTHS